MAKTISRLCMLFLVLAISTGCTGTDKPSFLENGDFKTWNGSISLPEGWNLEGNGLEVSKTDEVAKKVGDSVIRCSFLPEGLVVNSPFLFQQVKDVVKVKGREITLGAWVKTTTPNAVALEFSDRAGLDIKGAPHPGDGKWRYLEVSHKLPEQITTIEYRLRFYAPAEAMFANATLTEAGWF